MTSRHTVRTAYALALLHAALSCGGSTTGEPAADDTSPDRDADAAPAERQVEILADGFVLPQALHLVDDFLYFGDFNTGKISRVHNDGGVVDELVQADGLRWLAVGDEVAVWANTLFQTFSVPLAGGDAQPIGEDAEGILGIGVASEYAYWIRGAPFTTLMRAPISTGEPEEVVIEQDGLLTFTLAGDRVYLAARTPKVGYADLVGDLGVDWIATDTLALDLVFADSTLFYIGQDDQFDTNLYRLDLRTRILETLSGPHTFIDDIEHHGGFVYFNSEQGIARIPVAGGELEVVAPVLSEFVHLAVNDSYVYWLDEEAGTLLRVAQPAGK